VIDPARGTVLVIIAVLSSSQRWALIWIVVGSVLIRLALMAGSLNRLDDPDHYLTLARSIAEGRGFAIDSRPTAYRPPLYPILLTPLVASLPRSALPWGVGVLHLTLGVGTVLLTYRAAQGLGLARSRCLLATAIVAFDPVLVAQCRSVMTETLAGLLVAVPLAVVSISGWRGPVLAGISLGLASLCRPSFLPAIVVAGFFAIVAGPGPIRTRLRRSALLMIASVAILSPWAWRNALIFGEPIWSTTHGGYTMALANNPVYYAEVLDGPAGSVWSGPNQANWFDEVGRSTLGMSESQADRFLRSKALQLVRDRPKDFVRASIARLGRFWGLAPSESVYPWWLRAISTAWTVPLWTLLSIGLVHRENWKWPRILAPSILISLTIVHAIYWTDLRMRAPLIPVIAVLAAGASPRRWLESRAGLPDLAARPK